MVSLSSYADVGSMAQSLQQSIDAAVKRVQQQATGNGGATGKVQEYEQTVNKSAMNAAPFATSIGTLIKDTSRLNVFSSLASNDPADFYKFNVPTSGAVTLGTVGDAGVRLQLMDRSGKVVADSNKDAGASYDAFQKLKSGQMTLDKGDYTLRVARDKDVPVKDAKSYGVQLRMGNYSKDYDTIAKQPAKGDNPFGGNTKLQSLASILGAGSASLNPSAMLLGGSGGSYGGRGSLLNALL
ncbi:hypothetical protein GBZ48_08885 [Azospirillum melinis]|uniref:Uncharacterized protein n=1 Tax=Azospirillum melinis TaxID=328839 RepID=A0ABX2K9A9_9PROT|nr:hypothetical protein [Azospirillum melinis]MBP2308863.1 hypothetical protein [Azospirillum melinis]NUA99405.1 hypothetical protein [Azospirillum melinis]